MDAKFKMNIDVSVIHFNRDIKTAVDFKLLKEINESDIIVNEFSEGSYMGQAILTEVNMAYEHRQKLIRESNGVAIPNQPLVFLLTDGQPDAGVGATDEEKEEVRLAFEEACNLIKEKERSKKLFLLLQVLNTKTAMFLLICSESLQTYLDESSHMTVKKLIFLNSSDFTILISTWTILKG